MRSILKYSICILFFFAIFKNAVAQDRTLDSLKQLLTTAKNDTIKCKILSSIIENAPDGIWEPYNNQLKKLAEKNLKTTKVNSPEYFFYKENLASAISNIGYSYVQHSELLKSLDNYLEALKIQKEIGYKYGMAITMSNLSNIFRKQGDIAKSLEW
ncbi:MAG: tetratricopeptide repeat protein, partial [Bacteroidia bacterium]